MSNKWKKGEIRRNESRVFIILSQRKVLVKLHVHVHLIWALENLKCDIENYKRTCRPNYLCNKPADISPAVMLIDVYSLQLNAD